MSDPTFQTPIYGRANGSVQTIDTGGTIQVLSGGQINVAAGGSIVNAGEQSITGNITVPSGGTITVASGGSIQQAGDQHVTGLTNVASGGTLNVASGGSIQIASGGVETIAAGGSIRSISGIQATTITLGGTQGRWAFGTAALTSGVGTVATGLTRVMSANANTILGEASGNGSATGVHVDLTLSGAGSVIFRALAGTLGYSAGATISFSAFGT